MKLTETITITIDPDDITYTTNFSNAYIDDIYAVLRDLVFRIENGEIYNPEHTNLSLEKVNGQYGTREEFVEYIRELKKRVDEVLWRPPETNNICRSSGN